MKRIAILIAAVSIGFTPSAKAQNPDELDVAIVFSTEAAVNFPDALNQFNTIKAYIVEAFDDSGVNTIPSVFLYSSVHDFPGADSAWNLSAVQVELALSDIWDYRNANDIDLILVVLSDYSGSGCGEARGPINDVPTVTEALLNPARLLLDSQRHVAIVTTDASGCATKTKEKISAHELGHLLYAEHPLVFDSNGSPISMPGVSGYDQKFYKPKKYNHGATFTTFGTLMAELSTASTTQVYSGTGNEIETQGATVPSVGPWTNVRKFLNQNSSPYVSLFRPLSSTTSDPPGCTIRIDRICGQPYTVLLTPQLAGHTITSVDMKYQNNGVGPWYDLYEGPFTCPGFTTAIMRVVRAIFTTTQGVSYCETVVFPVYQPPGCGGGNF